MTLDSILLALIVGGVVIGIAFAALATHRRNQFLEGKIKEVRAEREHWADSYHTLDQNYDALDELCRTAQKRVCDLGDENIKLWNQNRTLKGVITKLKKRLDVTA